MFGSSCAAKGLRGSGACGRVRESHECMPMGPCSPRSRSIWIWESTRYRLVGAFRLRDGSLIHVLCAASSRRNDSVESFTLDEHSPSWIRVSLSDESEPGRVRYSRERRRTLGQRILVEEHDPHVMSL